MNEHDYWQAIQQRDARYDGQFVYGVRSTGIYCRPSCSSRQPLRENVSFFVQPEQAEQAGFRPCKRCQPRLAHAPDPQLELVERICRLLAEECERPPSLKALSQQFALSPYYLQRLFKRITGVSPRQYADAQRVQRLKAQLTRSQAVTPALYDAGYASSSSLYAQSFEQLGMTPSQYRRKGYALMIVYTTLQTPLGRLLVAATERGLCAVRLGDDDASLVATLRNEFAAAQIERDDAALQGAVAQIVAHLEGHQPHIDLPTDVRATAFQRQVWQALRSIPYGETRSYSEVAEQIGRPTAVRAVARACASNPLALVVPCHRVIREDGSLGGYRWGIERKQKLLEQEKQLEAQTQPA